MSVPGTGKGLVKPVGESRRASSLSVDEVAGEEALKVELLEQFISND